MPYNVHIAEHERHKIVLLKEQGYTVTEIAAELGCSVLRAITFWWRVSLILLMLPVSAMTSRLLAFWRRSLQKHPVITNTAVYASFYTAAELSQQTYNKLYSPEKPEIDFAAAARIAGVGSTVYAPTLYFWYRLLDRKFAGTALKNVATKVAADQFIMTPILLATFYILLGVLERREDVFEELKEKYWKSFIANQAFWIPGQTINFFFMPPHLRVVYVASTSFIWINVLCFIKRQKSEKTE